MIKDRIFEYLEYKAISKYRFYKDTGISNGYLDKKGSIGEDLINKIAEAYPEIDMNWLVSGIKIGEKPNDYMLKKKLTDESGVSYIDKAEWYSDRYLEKDYDLKGARTEIEELKVVNKYLENRLQDCLDGK